MGGAEDMADDPRTKSHLRLLRLARMQLADARRQHVEDLLRSKYEAEKSRNLKAIVEAQKAVDAVDLAIDDWWPSTRTTTMLSVLSTFIAAAALLTSAYNAYTTYQFQKEAKQIDAAVSWCREFTLPYFVAYQQDARQLRPTPASDYTIRDEDRDPATATLKSADEIIAYLRRKGIKDDAREKVTASLVGLLNYIETGATMVARGDMERERFLTCFSGFKEQYFARWSGTYIGLLLSYQATPPGAKLKGPTDFFDKAACVTDPKITDPSVCIKKRSAANAHRRS